MLVYLAALWQLLVNSQYGIHSLRQTVGTVKLAVWNFFTETVHIKMCLFCLNAVLYFGVCVCVCFTCFMFATFWCNKQINK